MSPSTIPDVPIPLRARGRGRVAVLGLLAFLATPILADAARGLALATTRGAALSLRAVSTMAAPPATTFTATATSGSRRSCSRPPAMSSRCRR